MINEKKVYEYIVNAIREHVKHADLDGVVIGVSGGIDSSLVSAMAIDAIGADRVHLVSVPSKYSSQGSINDAKHLAQGAGASFEILPIHSIHDAYDDLLHLTGVPDENLQARIRGTMLMSVANGMGKYAVLNTCNKTEDLIGYFTLYGDSIGVLSPLGDLYKKDVYALAKWRNSVSPIIPENSIIKPPSAELSEGQLDSDDLPEYEVLDNVLEHIVKKDKSIDELIEIYGEETVHRIEYLMKRAQWKLGQCPPVVSIEHLRER